MSMHATMSLADGVVDPVIASRAKLQISRESVAATRALNRAAKLEDSDITGPVPVPTATYRTPPDRLPG